MTGADPDDAPRDDAGLDDALTRHGAAWRTTHSHPPVVDWSAVTGGRPGRSRLVAAGAAGLVVVAIVLVVSLAGSGGHHPDASATHSAVSPSSTVPPDPHHLRYGSPFRYFGLDHGAVLSVVRTARAVDRDQPRAVAVGGSGQGTAVYDAQPAPHCRTHLAVTSYVLRTTLYGRGISTEGAPESVNSFAGEPMPTPIAVSSASGQLALVVTPALARHPRAGRSSRGPTRCDGPEEIVFVSLRNGHVLSRVPVTTNDEQVANLQWSADGQQLAYQLRGVDSLTRLPSGGTHVLPVDHRSNLPLDSYPRILPLAPGSGRASLGPVIFWHGALAVFKDGSLDAVDADSHRAAVLATGFPDQVDTVSVDSTGEHVLIGADGASYRWDYGQLTRLPGDPEQPTW